MHIAYYCPVWPPLGATNGIVTYVSVIRDYLLRAGHDVSILSNGTLHLANGVTVALDQSRPRRDLLSRVASRIDRHFGHHPIIARQMAGQFVRACGIVPVDLIEMEETFGWSGTIADRVAVPVVTRLHGPQFLKSEGHLAGVSRRQAKDREKAEGRALRKARAVTAPTAALLAATQARYRCTPTHSKVVPNPVMATPAAELWQRDRCEPDTLLCVGRLDIAKGADTVIAAFARVIERRPNARLTMVGPAGQVRRSDGSLAPFLDQIAKATPRDVLERITFTGRLDPADILPLRRRAFLTVMPSPNETFSYAALEAMTTGCPLIATDWPGAREIIDDGFTGWLTPVGDVAAMAARIAWVLEHPELAAAVGANARQQSSAAFSVETVGAAMVDFYEAVLADRRSA